MALFLLSNPTAGPRRRASRSVPQGVARHVPRRAAALYPALLLSVGLLAACKGLDPVETYQQVTDPAQLFFAVRIDQPAVNLSTVTPYDTLRLTAKPLSAQGEPLSGLPAPTFRLSQAGDSTVVTVTADGLLQALGDARGVRVIAELAIPGGARFADTASVSVISSAPLPVARLDVDPPDSTTRTMGLIYDDIDLFVVPPQAWVASISLARTFDTAGNLITPPGSIEYRTLEPQIARFAADYRFGYFSDFPMNTRRPGQVRVVARTVAYGDTLADTVLMTVSWPVIAWVYAYGPSETTPVFIPSDIRIPPHGMVIWKSLEGTLGDAMDITFDDPTHVTDPSATPGIGADLCTNLNLFRQPAPYCGSGDVLVPPSFTSADEFKSTRVRQFHDPGVYTYHSTRTGATGRVIVTSNTDPTALP